MTPFQTRVALQRLPPGDRAPFLAGLARRHVASLTQLGAQPQPGELVSAAHQRRRHRRELDQLQRLGRVFGLVVPGVGNA